MKTRAHIWAAIGVCAAFLHYHLFRVLVLSALGCELSSDPCSVSAVHNALIDILGFPLWPLPSEPFVALPGVASGGIEPLEAKAAVNAMLWGLAIFGILQLAVGRSKASD